MPDHPPTVIAPFASSWSFGGTGLQEVAYGLSGARDDAGAAPRDARRVAGARSAVQEGPQVNNPFTAIFERIYTQLLLPMAAPVAVVLACIGVAMWMGGKREGVGRLGIALAAFALILLMPQIITLVQAIVGGGG